MYDNPYNNIYITSSGIAVGTTTNAHSVEVNGTIGISGTNILEFGVGQSKGGVIQSVIGSATYDSYLDLVGIGASGSRYVKIFDALYVGSTSYTSDQKMKTNIQ